MPGPNEKTWVAPGYVAIGDPTIAAGAGMVDLGLANNVEVTITFSKQTGNNAQGQMLATGRYTRGIRAAQVAVTLHDKQQQILAAAFSEVVVGASSTGWSTEFKHVDPPSLVVLPVEGLGASAATFEETMWFPAVDASAVSAFIRNITESNEATNPYTITFDAMRREKDQADQALADGYKMMFEGDPKDGLTPNTTTWTVPPAWTT